MFNKLDSVVKRYNLLTEKLADPKIYDNQKEFKETSEERASLEKIVETYQEYKKLSLDVEGARDILKNSTDADLKEMAKEELSENESAIEKLKGELKLLLLPKDPLDDKNVIVEIRAGAGGDEASIFVGDVYRMYQNYFRHLSFKFEVVSLSKNDEGIKEIICSVSGDKVYSKLKYESGVHRVQRVPKTESQGRIHTSTITVAVLPEPGEIDFVLDMNDVRIDVYRAGGCGGQSVNTTDSAVRVTHIPTGTVVAIQDEKSQIKNKDKALKILRSRLYDQKVQEARAKEAAERKEQVGTGDRSERIRTYNFPQGRVTDHRIGLTLYNLEAVMEGDMGEITEALIAHKQAEALQGGRDDDDSESNDGNDE
ncbi:MAG: peptide chain release factor 1 [Oligoflexia bacterium]|nr:peptide chain release factor 1 [Oligoflexia bacterium]MBF0366372.1 peptide chain release factor 1 [Oligoflexia bacterium]